MQIIGALPDLDGQRCDGLICQEFWHAGELSDPANVLFLRAGGAWHRFFIDAGVLFWRAVDAPDRHDTTAMDEYHYPRLDLGERYAVAGRRILGITRGEAGGSVWLNIAFEGGLRLVLSNRDDVSRLEIGPGSD